MEHTAETVAKKVTDLVKPKLDHAIDELKTIDTFETLGLDSLHRVELCMEVENYFNIDISDSVMESWKGPQDICNTIKDILNIESCG